MKILFFIFLANFIFVVLHLKMNPAINLTTVKALTSLQSKRKIILMLFLCSKSC